MTDRNLASEIGKSSPFDSTAQEAHLNILRTASVLGEPFDHLFASHGISDSLYNSLRILQAAGNKGRLCHEISNHLVARVPDVTRLVDRLEKLGLAVRRRSTTDRRAVYVQITPAGLDLLSTLHEPVMQLHESQLNHLSKSELTELSRLLVKARTKPAQ